MNKYEVNEIKKNFRSSSGFFTLNKIIVKIVNGEGDIKHSIEKAGALLDSREEDMYYSILKNVLSIKVGRNLMQYDFSKEAYNKGHIFDVLTNVIDTGFNSDAELDKYVNTIIDGYQSDSPYAIVSAYCTYVVRRRDKLGVIKDQEDIEYKYIITALCPVISVDSGFSYNNQTGEFSTECDPKLYIQSKPVDGFLYPAFDDRSPNVNSVMYYCKKSSDADVSIINDVLECDFVYTADQEIDTLHYVLKEAFGDKANYLFMYAFNTALVDLAETHKDSSRLYEMSYDDFNDVLVDIGAEENELKAFHYLYEKYIGENKLKLNNLIENRIKLKTAEYTISFSTAVGSRVSTVVTDGAKTIKLTTDDTRMEFNDTEVTI